MIVQQGRIVAVEGLDAVVQIGRRRGCPACDAGQGCGAGIFARLLRDKPVSIRVANVIGAEVGASVELGISENRFLALVARLYAMPLLAGLLGAAIGFWLSIRAGLRHQAADILSLVSGVAGAAVVLLLQRRKLREFTEHSAVNLSRVTTTPTDSACMATGPDDLKVPENTKYVSDDCKR
jgi:sigma-E factor negative regulatory protein RseC